MCDDDKITTDGSNTYTSQLKSCLLTNRTIRYDDSLSFRTNICYPLVLVDRLSLEIWPLPRSLERDLLLAESDTSDNNLGIGVEHRLSVYIQVCTRCATTRYYNGAIETLTNSSVSYLCDRDRSSIAKCVIDSTK